MSNHKHCRIKGCEVKLYCAGYCKHHYQVEMDKGIRRRRDEDGTKP